METFGDVTVSLDDAHVAEVEMHRPPANYFDAALLSGILEAIRWTEGQGGRAAVLCSEERHFCAGLDFGNMAKPDLGALRTLYDQAIALVSGPLPLVVAVQGAAVGGGLGLAMAGDFRVGTPDSRYSANFARLGFHQGFGLSVTLPATVGRQAASALLFTGRRIDGYEALRIGLCDRLSDDPRAGAHALAHEIARVGASGCPVDQGHAPPWTGGLLCGCDRARAVRTAAPDGNRGFRRGHRRIPGTSGSPVPRSVTNGAATPRPDRPPTRRGWPHSAPRRRAHPGRTGD